MWPVARAERGVLGLVVMGIRWTSDWGVRWGREMGGVFEGVGSEMGVLGKEDVEK